MLCSHTNGYRFPLPGRKLTSLLITNSFPVRQGCRGRLLRIKKARRRPGFFFHSRQAQLQRQEGLPLFEAPHDRGQQANGILQVAYGQQFDRGVHITQRNPQQSCGDAPAR